MVLIVIGIADMATVASNRSKPSKESEQYINDVRLVVPLLCGSELAVQDLAGVCRTKPNPTSGALEAVSAPNPSGMKVQIQSKSALKK